MHFLPCCQIVHGDLKAENVLLSPRQNCPGGSKSAAKVIAAIVFPILPFPEQMLQIKYEYMPN